MSGCHNLSHKKCALHEKVNKKVFDRGRTRTCNPQRRKLMPYPLGHTAIYYCQAEKKKEIAMLLRACVKETTQQKRISIASKKGL